jgi:hypothetical protein
LNPGTIGVKGSSMSPNDASLEILPGIGLGCIRFGMSEFEVREILGEPEESRVFDEDRHLYYHGWGIFLFFDADGGDGGGVLSGMEVEAACRCTLLGEKVFPGKRDDVHDLLKRLTPDEFASKGADVVFLEFDGSTRISSSQLGMHFYFSTDGFLESINWS